uniref:NHL repeat containing 2 n=1 Tax=Eptatretus burgeri TaxID=7764 RepID=A0A8C4R492_EPTBU
ALDRGVRSEGLLGVTLSSSSKLTHQLLNLTWLNVERALSLHNDLHGKIVLLDFFTYCCINCLHILPDLQTLERCWKDTDGLVVIGVHSAKFPHEKVTDGVLAAVQRHNIEHPVVCDGEAQLWQALGVSCWPTVLLIGPRANPLFAFAGEGHSATLSSAVAAALRYYRCINHSPVGLAPFKEPLPSSILRFPGKICLLDEEEGQPAGLVIADTGNHRVLVIDTTGQVLYCVGGKNWQMSLSTLQAPAGVTITWLTALLTIIIDLQNDAVSTLVGTGVQSADFEGGNVGPKQPISSPWDVEIGYGEANAVLYIAMAGSHQVWAYTLQDCTLPRGRKVNSGTCVCVAGSGREENRNNVYPHKAGFAQPSGIGLGQGVHGPCLFVADSESSSVRVLSLSDGAVQGLVGGERDPMNLFAYGDVDGTGVDAKLQHPLGIAWSPPNGPLYVADSYNHKVKMIELKTKMCRTLFEHVTFNEPGGLCVSLGGELLYVADTNHHRIQVLDMKKRTASTLKIHFLDLVDVAVDSTTVNRSIVSRTSPRVHLKPVTIAPGQVLRLLLSLDLPAGACLTEGAPSYWQVQGSNWFLKEQVISGCLTRPPDETVIVLQVPGNDDVKERRTTLSVESLVYYCLQKEGMCLMKGITFTFELHLTEEQKAGNIQVSLVHKL